MTLRQRRGEASTHICATVPAACIASFIMSAVAWLRMAVLCLGSHKLWESLEQLTGETATARLRGRCTMLLLSRK